MAKEPFVEKNTTIFIGGFFFWIIMGFRNKLEYQLSEKYTKRNFINGYTLLIFVLILLIFIKISS
jgi:hypothetical protein